VYVCLGLLSQNISGKNSDKRVVNSVNNNKDTYKIFVKILSKRL